MSIYVISQRNHDYAEQIRYTDNNKKSMSEGKTFAHHPMRICVSVYFLKKSQPCGGEVPIIYQGVPGHRCKIFRVSNLSLTC